MTATVGSFVEPAVEVDPRATLADLELGLHADRPHFLRASAGWETLVPRLLVGVPRSRRVLDVPRAACQAVSPEADAVATLAHLDAAEPGVAAVVHGGRLLGHVSRERLRRALASGDAAMADVTLEVTALRMAARGLGHDLANALCVAECELELGAEGDRDALRGAVSHAMVLVERLRTIAEGAAPASVDIELGHAVSRLLPVLRSVAGRAVLVKRVPGPPVHARAPRGFVDRALVNFVANAAEAMGRGAGVIRVAARREGSHAVLEVRDDGPGMGPDVVARVLDPGFSTKGDESIRGVGLAAIRAAAATYGGQLHVESTLGAGTRVELRLPPAD